MANNKLTFIAEFVDRLTGPSEKTRKAVERLGKTTKDQAAATERANKQSASATERAQRRTTRALGQTNNASNRSARAMQQMAGVHENASNRTSRAMQRMAQGAEKSLGGLHRATGRVRAEGMVSRWNASMDRMYNHTSRRSTEIGNMLDRMGSRAALGVGVVGGLGLAGGLRRINDVQQSNVVMETMELSAGAREQLMGQFKGLAQDTPFSTGSIASLGSGLIASGMDQSKVENSLQGAIDTAALFGMSLEEMALPLKQMQAKGVLQGDDLNQLMDRNIPLMDWLAKQKGVDRSQVKDMVSKGQVSADDVFAALATNSKGGAERAAGTLKGSWTNFMSSISQGGEAFLAPMTDDITELLKVSKGAVNDMKPFLGALGQFGSIVLKVLTPAMPVLIPLVTGFTVALAGLKVARGATAAVSLLAGRQGLGGLASSLVGGRGATSLMEQFGFNTKSTGRHAADTRSVLGKLTGEIDGTRHATRRGADGFLTYGKNIGKLVGIVGGVTTALAVLDAAMGDVKASSEAEMTNKLKTGGGLVADFGNQSFADGNRKDLLGFPTGGPKNAGESMKYFSGGRGALGGVWDSTLGNFIDSPRKAQREWFTNADAALSGMPGTPTAGSEFAKLLNQGRQAGMSEQDVLNLFPNYKDAVLNKMSDQQIRNDGNVLQYMMNPQGFRLGGWTGDGPASAIAGVVHGREYVMPEPVTRRPGVLTALRQIHRTGEVPSKTSHANVRQGDTLDYSTTVNVTANTASDAATIKREVQAVLDRNARRMANQHGTMGLRGAL
ncbi:tape measure protein [Kocuria sp. cx-455]|uniref:tape measure protein n=1 Tax=Kocuria sp. cx-455 TaxID=2771377 RepID=UPI003D725A59